MIESHVIIAATFMMGVAIVGAALIIGDALEKVQK